MNNVLITGGSGGLGASLAKVFAKNGFNILIGYNLNKKNACDLKNEIEKDFDAKATVVKCDISCVQDIESVFKNNKIDILINNASISMDDSILNKTKEEFMKVLEINLVGTFLMCKEAIKKDVGTIINISSTDSIDTYNSFNIDYSSSKAGVNIVTKTIAAEYPNVRVFAILPNFINTDSVLQMNKEYLNDELKRIGQEKLLDKEEVSKKIYSIYKNEKIKSGSLIRIDFRGELCIEVLE